MMSMVSSRISDHVYSFGLNNYGQLGVGDTTDRLFSSKLNFFGEKTIKSIILGDASTLYLLTTSTNPVNQVWAIGKNEVGI
jgi:alpha-tubulin suppressor-like RCC1 family protein